MKSNSTKIQVQLHKKIVSSFIALLLHSKGGEFSMTLHSSAISTTIDVNSLLLSPVFPKMGELQDDRDVIFDIKAPEVNFSFNGQNLRF